MISNECGVVVKGVAIRAGWTWGFGCETRQTVESTILGLSAGSRGLSERCPRATRSCSVPLHPQGLDNARPLVPDCQAAGRNKQPTCDRWGCVPSRGSTRDEIGNGREDPKLRRPGSIEKHDMTDFVTRLLTRARSTSSNSALQDLQDSPHSNHHCRFRPSVR